MPQVHRNDLQFLSGGGEMGELTRAKDWSKTTVGDPENWPQSLRTTLSILLNSKFPMFLFWGPELICFYNDAYRPSLGKEGKHPDILGGRGEDFWKEIWHIIKPLIDQVLAGGEATWSEDQLIPIYRNGKIEDVYWTFSYSPVNDESGKSAGVFVTCNETTGKVNTLKELEESKNQLEFAIEATELGTWDYDPLTNKFTSNERIKQWFGLSAAEHIELSHAINAMHENDRQRVSDAIQRALDYSSGGKYDIEYTIVNPVSKKEIIVHAKGRAWFNDEKMAYRFNGTLQDITQKETIAKKIEQSEERFHNLIYSSPSAIGILYGEDLIITIANDAIIQIWGKGKEIMGKAYFEALPELAEQGYKEVFAQVYKTGIPFSAVETPIQLLQNGVMQQKYYNFLLYPQRNINGEIDGIGIIATEVTSQALLNYKVKESEQRFAAAVQAVKGIVWTNNDKGEMVGEQQGWASLTGQSYNEYQGFGWAKAVHPDDAQPTIEAWNEAVKKAKTFNFEHRVKTKDGIWRDFSIRAIPLLNDDGTLRQWVGVHTDITESKQAAKALRDNEEKLNIVINASELGTWQIDVKTGKVTNSERFLEIMGYKQKIDLTLDDTVKRIHPDYLQLRNEAFKKAYETGVLYFTGQVVWQDNSLHWVGSKGKVFYDEQKKPVTIIGTIADITEHKRHEQILFESEQKFRVLADSMPQHIWTSDPEGNLNYYNRSVFDYSGLTVDQLNKDGWIQIVHPDERKENIRQWTNSIITGKDFLLEHRFRRHDGVYRWQLSRAIPQKDENGKIQMWVGTSTDIQDIKELDQQKDSFLSMASHELKTPVTTIKAYGQIAEAMLAKKGDTETLVMVTKMGTQVNRLTNLIGDLLDITKIQKGKLRYNEDMFDFNDVVKEVVDDMQKTSATHGIKNNSREEVKIYGDKDKISQVLNNLISNAIKYSPKADSIIIDTQVKENGIELSVKDFGIGIPAEEKANVFEQFYRVNGNNQSTFPGMGIGLFICSEITKMHGGKIWAESVMGKGSTFYMWLPFDHREISNNKIPD